MALKQFRWRTVLFAAIAGMIVSTAVMLPIALVLYNDAKANANAGAHANCLITASARPQGNARAFVEREILTVADEAFRLFPAKFRNAEDLQIAQAARREIPHAPGTNLGKVQGFMSLQGVIADAPLLSCAHNMRP
jgi:hypothetical protein